ncbi:MAG: DUF177 domain-containing protein [Bacteroidia bacterium]|nr:DUF177 domain-containing protein [Bacteroidia bacterium]
MGKTKYIIKTGGLPVGTHEFEFEVTGAFFKENEANDIRNANINVQAELLKQNNVLQLSFDISGTVEMECDRCLKEYNFPIHSEEKLVVKYGNPKDSDDEVLVVPEGETDLNITQQIYEFVLTALPNRKVPCEIDEEFECDEEVLSKLNQNSTTDESENNPLWDKLNKIKLNKN